MECINQFNFIGFYQWINVNRHGNDKNDEHLTCKNKPLCRKVHGRFKTKLFVGLRSLSCQGNRMINQIENKRKADGKTCQNTNQPQKLSLIHISEPTRLGMISYAVFCLKKKKHHINKPKNNHKQ